MNKKEKDLKPKRKRKDIHLRFALVFLAFLIETALFIFVVFIFSLYDFDKFFLLGPVILTVVLDIVLGLFIIGSGAQIDFKVSWLCVLLLFPFVGAIIYLLYAHKITTKKQKKLKLNPINQYLENQQIDCTNVLNELKEKNPDAYLISSIGYKHHYSIFKNTNLKYYSMGEFAFDDILEALKSAKRFIFLEFFIVEDGLFFGSIYDILKKKAKEGVEVRFLYDDFGCSSKMPSNFHKLARKNNIKCHPFNRISPTMNIRQNSRDHRKIIIVDGIVSFTGGCNLADEYINKVNRFGIWKDNFIRLEGEATQGLTTIFLSNFHLYQDKDEDVSKFNYQNNKDLLEKEIINNDSFIHPLADIPYDNGKVLKNVFLSLINRAKKSIYLSTPYLIPDTELMNALINASLSGIDVTIFTPGIPDKKIVFQATRSYYAPLLMNGVKIYEFTPGFNHEKTMIIDDNLALTGTCNFDYRSFYLHFENSVLIYNDPEIAKMKNSFIEMLKSSKEQKEEKYINVSFFRKLYWSILRVIAPLL